MKEKWPKVIAQDRRSGVWLGGDEHALMKAPRNGDPIEIGEQVPVVSAELARALYLTLDRIKKEAAAGLIGRQDQRLSGLHQQAAEAIARYERAVRL